VNGKPEARLDRNRLNFLIKTRHFTFVRLRRDESALWFNSVGREGAASMRWVWLPRIVSQSICPLQNKDRAALAPRKIV
jgi:hypothetical protein